MYLLTVGLQKELRPHSLLIGSDFCIYVVYIYIFLHLLCKNTHLDLISSCFPWGWHWGFYRRLRMIKTSYCPSLLLCTCILIDILTAFNPASFLRRWVRKCVRITRQWEMASVLPVRCLTHSRAREDLFISYHSSVDGAREQTGGQEVHETAKK